MNFIIPQYYDGEKTIKKFQKPVSGGVIEYEIVEYWEGVHSEARACGKKGTITVSKMTGIAKEQLTHFETVLGASLGIKDLLSFKAELTAKHEVSLKNESSVTHTSTYEIAAPPCGKLTIVVCQLVREYRFRHIRFLRPGERTPHVTEAGFKNYLSFYDCIENNVEYIPGCPCSPPASPQRYYTVQATVENVNISYTGKLVDNTVTLWNQAIAVSGEPFGSGILRIIINTAFLPSYVRFFGGLDKEQYELEVFSIRGVPPLQEMPGRPFGENLISNHQWNEEWRYNQNESSNEVEVDA